MKNNKIYIFILKFLAYFSVFYVLFNASVSNVVYPFAFGMFFALVWVNQKIWLVVPAYILSGVLFQPTLEFSICTLTSAFCLIIPYFIHVLFKKNMKKYEFAIFGLLGQVAKVVFECLEGIHPAASLAGVTLGIMFMFACMSVFEAVVIRGFSNKLTSTELVSLFSIIASICAGLVSIRLFDFSFLKLFMSFVLLIFCFCSTPTLSMLVASVGGIGTLIATNDTIYVAPFILWVLAMLLFKGRRKIFMAVGLICVEVLSVLYFKLYNSSDWLEILPVALATVGFVLFPMKWCNEIAVIFNLSKDRLAMKNVVNRNREILHRRLGELSEIFNDMNIIYRNMLKQGMSLEQVKEVLRQEISEKICSYCPERNHCHRTFADNTKKVFDELITISYEKGKVTLLDIPSYLTSRCKQTNAILGSINSLTGQYKKYISMMHDVDTSKMIVADQLFGISKIMRQLSKEVENNVSFDTVRENKILDELTYNNIICIDAVVFERDIWTQMASVVVRDVDSEKQKIVDVVSKVCGKKMAVYENFPSFRPGYNVLNLKTAPKYDCMFGISQKTKNGSNVSGDNYSVVRLDGEKLLFAISDGMGSGETAQKASEISIGLIENFYKAGFDNDLILSTVNKLLNLHKEEIFSAIDICVVDEKNGTADFIKMASPNSFILSDDICKVIDAGALPMGIVDEATPLTNKAVLDENDLVILVSDGISDSFETVENLKECIKSIRTKNPQEFSDELLERTLACNNGYAVDDMSVIVIKILSL